MNPDYFAQKQKKENIKSSIETYLFNHENIDSDIEEALLESKAVLSLNSKWKEIDYEKYGRQKRAIDENSEGRNIAHMLYKDIVVPFLVNKVKQDTDLIGNVEYIFLYGSLISVGEPAHYTSNIDLNVCIKDEVSEEQFDILKEKVFEMAKPIAEAMGRDVSSIIQVNYKSKTLNPNLQESTQVLRSYVHLSPTNRNSNLIYFKS